MFLANLTLPNGLCNNDWPVVFLLSASMGYSCEHSFRDRVLKFCI